MSRLKHQFRTPSLNLTADDIAAAEAVGCIFQPLPPSQLSRFAMQRKIFYVDGKPVLATRGGGLYETAATLTGLLEFGRERIRAGLVQMPPPMQDETPAIVSEVAPEPPVVLQALVAPQPEPEEVAKEVTAPAAKPRAVRKIKARSRGIRRDFEPVLEPEPVDFAPPSNEPAPLPVTARRTRRTQESREPKWMTAGADRRGRASVHWSTRQR